MKKNIFFILVLSLYFYGCDSGASSSTPTKDDSSLETNGITIDKKGEKIDISKNDQKKKLDGIDISESSDDSIDISTSDSSDTLEGITFEQ